jgi:hypothetical protein
LSQSNPAKKTLWVEEGVITEIIGILGWFIGSFCQPSMQKIPDGSRYLSLVSGQVITSSSLAPPLGLRI